MILDPLMIFLEDSLKDLKGRALIFWVNFKRVRNCLKERLIRSNYDLYFLCDGCQEQ
jgi:hypothetical protein